MAGIGTKGKFIKSPADAAGLKMRVQPSIVHPLTWKAMGIPVNCHIDTGDALASGKANAFRKHRSIRLPRTGRCTSPTTSATISTNQGSSVTTESGLRLWVNVKKPFWQTWPRMTFKKAVRKLSPQLLDNLDSFGIKMYKLLLKRENNSVRKLRKFERHSKKMRPQRSNCFSTQLMKARRPSRKNNLIEVDFTQL